MIRQCSTMSLWKVFSTMDVIEIDRDDESKHEIMKLESSELKKEFPDTKEIFKRETNATVKDESNCFSTEHCQTSENSPYVFINKESTCDYLAKDDCDTSISSCRNQSPECILTSKICKNSVVSNNIFSIHTQDFDKSKTQGYSFNVNIEQAIFYMESFPENGGSRIQLNRVGEKIKDKNETTADEMKSSGHLTMQPECVNKKVNYIYENSGQGFSSKTNLKEHIYTQLYRYNKYKCSICSHGFPHKYRLKNHIDSVHYKIKTIKYVCEHCRRRFSRKTNLKEHIYTHIDRYHKHKCSLCSHGFPFKHRLKRHIDQVHNKTKEHMCNLCFYEFSSKRSLKKHIDSVHNKVKQHKCNFCFHEYNTKSSLKRHINIAHNKIKENTSEFFVALNADRRNN